jgi:hypothetical protein
MLQRGIITASKEEYYCKGARAVSHLTVPDKYDKERYNNGPGIKPAAGPQTEN